MGQENKPGALGVSDNVNWRAQMIAPRCDPGQGGRASFVSQQFHLRDMPSHSVRLSISAQGLYLAFINGHRVGRDLLTPGLTCYDDRIAFQTYDIAPLLSVGENRIEIWLADGWYRSQIMWQGSKIFNCWGERIAAIAQIEADGALLLATDESWKSGLLPVTQSGIYFGEDFDARLLPLEASDGVESLDFDVAKLVPHEAEPVVELAPLSPIESWQEENRATVYDFGQNCSGQIRFTAHGDAGALVRVEHSEILGPGKVFDNRNYRSARGELRYVLSGAGDETYQPLFTFMGYRYCRVTISGQAEIKDIQSIPVSSMPEQVSGFDCGDSRVNRLVLNTLWSLRSNFVEIPTDCPQRDERLGWTGDAQVFAGTACWLANAERFLHKYLRDVIHDQRPNGAIPHFSPDPTRLHPDKVEGEWSGSTGWGDVIVVMPWQLYLHYGDKEQLRAYLPAMKAWLDYLWSLSDGPIIHPSSAWGGHGFSFGDWLQPVGDNRKPRPTIGDDCAATLYHFISTDMAAKAALAVGEAELSKAWTARAETIRAAFAHEYFSASGRLAHNDQTSYALAFLYDLVPERYYEAAKGYFRRVIVDADYLIGTGFIGTPALLPALTRTGMLDLAEKVFLNNKVPGWLYQVEQGATTIWERWDALGPDGEIYDPEMNSYNHYAYGAVCQWLFEEVAGVTPVAEGAGFEVVRIEPGILPALGHVNMWHMCKLGRLEASWRIADAKVHYTLVLPEGCKGVIPASAQMPNLLIDGQTSRLTGTGVRIGAGRHEITFDLLR